MEKLDIEILQDMQDQMNQCTHLAIQYTSILASSSVNISSTVSSPECQQILRKLLSSLIMENTPSRVLNFLNVPIRFVTDDEKANLIMEETKKALERINLCWQDRLLNTIFNK